MSTSRLVHCLICIVLLFSIATVHGGPPRLVKDINPFPRADFNTPDNYCVAGTTLYFSYDDYTHGRELWKSDGTEAGTVLVKDLEPGSPASRPQGFRAIGDLAYFVATTRGANQLWRTDGTADGTYAIDGVSFPAELTAIGSNLYFVAEDTTHGRELWKLDGATASVVKDIGPGSTPSSPASLVAAGNTLYFTAFDDSGNELWQSDGTEQGTTQVKDILPGSDGSYPQGLCAVGQRLVFSARDATNQRRLWICDPTGAGTVMVADHNGVDILQAAGSYVYFLTTPPGQPRQLWKTDGTLPGTALVTNFSASRYLLGFRAMGAVGDTLYFSTGGDGVSDSDLWKTDGTPAGTMVMKHFRSGSRAGAAGEGPPTWLASLGNVLYFNAADGLDDSELWRSDGTPAGTYRVRDINPGNAPSSPSWLTSFAGALYFSATDSAHGVGLWRTDGTDAGTVPITRFGSLSTGSGPTALQRVGSTLYFFANDGVHGSELWKSDGTEQGTSLVKDFSPGISGTGPFPLTSAGLTAFFPGPTNTVDIELWKTNGTEQSTLLIKDIAPNGFGSSPHELVIMNGVLYFVANNATYGEELWRSDGTEAGTTIVKDIRPGGTSSSNGSSSPQELTVAGGILYFIATDDTGTGLWRTDGTEAGTVKISLPVTPGHLGPAIPYTIFTSPPQTGAALYFTAYTPEEGVELWRTYGTAESTAMVQALVPGHGSSFPENFTTSGTFLYFITQIADQGRQLWRTDGTAEGTVQLTTLPADRIGFAFTSVPPLLATGNGRVFFAADDGIHGIELWTSDGTPAGTTMIQDIVPGVSSSRPDQFAAIGGKLYFSVNDGIHGHELWRSDGTSEGTYMVYDLTGDSGSSGPTNLTPVGSKLYFTAFSDAGGQELYVYDTATPLLHGPPKVTLLGDNPLLLGAGSTFSELGATAADSEGQSLTPELVANTVQPNVPGTYVVTWKATDRDGNSATVSRTVKVVDTVPPYISPPQNILVNATSLAGAVVNYLPITATDFVGVTSLAFSPESGTHFPIGSTTVTVTATDAAGNTSTATFVVNVSPGSLDQRAPFVNIATPTGPNVGAAFDISGLVQDDTSFAGLTVSVNGTEYPLDTPIAFTPNTRLHWSVSGVTAENGMNTIDVTAFDRRGRHQSARKIVYYTNPRPTLAGLYQAVLRSGHPEPLNSAAFLRVTVNAAGRFSGQIHIGRNTQRFTGIINNSGQAFFNNTYPFFFPYLTPGLEMPTRGAHPGSLGYLAFSIDEATGLKVDGSLMPTTAKVARFGPQHLVPAALLNFPTKGTPQKGLYNVKLPSQAQTPPLDASLYPQGDGCLSLTITKFGAVTATGKLADGSGFSAANILREDGSVPLFIPLYQKTGFVCGDLAFADAPDSDVTGTGWRWFRPAQPHADLFPAGWAELHFDPLGTKYVRPTSFDFGQGAANLATGNVHLDFSNAPEPSPLSYALSFDPATGTVRKTTDHPAAYDLTFHPATGTYSGTFLKSGRQHANFNGLLLNKGHTQGGFGFYLNPANSSFAETGTATMSPNGP